MKGIEWYGPRSRCDLAIQELYNLRWGVTHAHPLVLAALGIYIKKDKIFVFRPSRWAIKLGVNTKIRAPEPLPLALFGPRRVARDGRPYTKSQFVEWYGAARGEYMWQRSLRFHGKFDVLEISSVA